jgi:hypothetical protein
MSADSDIATFRSSKQTNPSFPPPASLSSAEEESPQQSSAGDLMRLVSLEDACYQTKPEKAWFYDAGYREAILHSSPHPGYDMLLQILEHFHKPYFVMTTNIDRYFAKAGFPEDSLFETHGSVEALQCAKAGPGRCSGVWLWPGDTPLPVFNRREVSCDLNTGQWKALLVALCILAVMSSCWLFTAFLLFVNRCCIFISVLFCWRVL